MRKEQIFVIILAIVTFFVCNASLPTDIMESRNIVTAREMVSDGNWLVPTMNGELRLEKPPLPTWVAGAIETVCPDSLSAQRVAAGVMGLMWTLFMFLTAKQLTRREDFALLTAMVFLTCYHIVLMGRTATWDIYCHAFMMGGIYFLFRGCEEDASRQWRWFPLAGLMMGLSFLSKGPVSFYALLLPALIGSIGLPGVSLRDKWKGVTVMLLICVVVSAWWYVYLLLFQHDAVDAVIHKESGAWTNHNVRPWYYYWRFFSETGIWAVIMLAALALPYWKRTVKDSRTYLFSISWTLAALVLLSLMPEKKIRYLLPMMAPCSICIACLLTHFSDAKDRFSKILFQVNGYLVGIIALAIPAALFLFLHTPLPLVIAETVLFIAAGIFIIISTVHRQTRRFVYGVCAVFMLTECFLLGGVGKMFGNPDERSIRETRDIPQLKGIPFYYPEQEPLRIELVYEAHRKILPIKLNKQDEILNKLPFALVSKKYARQELSASILSQVDTMSIGTFDDNKHPRKDRHYTTDFINHITLIKKK